MTTTAADLVPYPPPVHLAWLATTPAIKGRTRDTVLTEGVARAILARPVVVEEKPDGALIGIASDGDALHVQHRNALLTQPAHA